MLIKYLFEKRIVKYQDAPKFCLIFYILASVVEIDGIDYRTYGIQVDKLNVDENCILASEKIYDITSDKLVIEKLIRKLFYGEAEPEILYDVISNYVGSLGRLSV